MSEDLPILDETPAPAPAEEGAPAARKPLGAAVWMEIRVAAELGQFKVSELARKYGITPGAVSNHLKAHGVVWGSRAKELELKTVEKVVEKAAEMSITFNEKRQQRIEETREKYYEYHKTLDGLLMKKVVDVVKAGGDLAELNGEAKAMLNIKRSLMVGRRERFSVLDADKTVDISALPDLIVRDLTEEEIARLQQGDDGLAELDEVIADIDLDGATIVETSS